ALLGDRSGLGGQRGAPDLRDDVEPPERSGHAPDGTVELFPSPTTNSLLLSGAAEQRRPIVRSAAEFVGRDPESRQHGGARESRPGGNPRKSVPACETRAPERAGESEGPGAPESIPMGARNRRRLGESRP
ncbi:hypothetical protein THAOC_27353, partial [Thalassiosira oceanica]